MRKRKGEREKDRKGKKRMIGMLNKNQIEKRHNLTIKFRISFIAINVTCLSFIFLQ